MGRDRLSRVPSSFPWCGRSPLLDGQFFGAVHDGMAATEAERVFEAIQALARVLVAGIANTGTESIGATGAPAPRTRCAAWMTRLPVTWARNKPPSPRRLMASTLPAILLRTVGSSCALSELSTNAARNRGIRRSTTSNMCQTVLCGATHLPRSAAWRTARSCRPSSGILKKQQ